MKLLGIVAIMVTVGLTGVSNDSTHVEANTYVIVSVSGAGGLLA